MTKTKTNPFVDRDDPVLREVALPVAEKDFGTKKLEEIIKKMQKALHAEEDGVAIAAPQIGESLRIFVVAGSAVLLAKRKSGEADDAEKTQEDLVFINPEIIKVSKKKKKMEEGCLSLRWLYGHVLRHEKVTIKAYTEAGKMLNVGASGLLAQIFQHEIDHLNGVLFTDKAENVRDLPPENEPD
jgi:peptide deformylase